MITVHSGWASDFSSLGLCSLQPTECTVEERAGGIFQLKMTHPMDSTGRWWYLQKWNIIKAPAPMRETPLISMGETGTVTRKIYKVNVNSRLRLRTKPSTSTGKIIGRYKNGTEVVRIDVSGRWYKVIVKDGGATGWMYSDYLTYVGEETQAIAGNDTPGKIVQPRQTREQLFRIMTVERDDAAQRVYVTALHVFYDLNGQLIKGEYAPEDVTASAAAVELFGRTIKEHDFEIYANCTAKISGEYTGRNLASALLETDGLIQQSGARLVRDNFDVFVLEDEARDRGVEIRHGKNLRGAVLTEDVSDVITSVVPVGKDEDGEPLYLDGTIYVDAPNVDEIPVVRTQRIEYDVRVGDGDDEFTTKKAARAELLRLAEEEFSANAINQPTVGLQVDFVALENTRQYAQYASLQSVHLYDVVRVYSSRSGIDAKTRVTGYVYNCLTKRFNSVTLGELYALNTTVSGFDIGSGTISGTKVISGSVSGDKLRNATINYAKIAQAAIEQLAADAITALQGRFAEIVAGNLTTDKLYAAMAEVVTLMVKSITAGTVTTDELYAALADVIVLRAQQITADNIETDKLAAAYAEITALLVGSIKAESIETDKLGAALANFVSMYAGTGEFDFATIQNLVAKAMSLEQGAMDTVYIKNLAVTSANLLSATLGKLVLKGDDGKYYRVFVSSTGEISTEEVEISSTESETGQTSGGQQIVETSMNVGSLNASNLQASSAVINRILTTALTAEKITAADALIASATIPMLYATTIQAIGNALDLSANESIKAMVAKKNATFYREDEPTEFVSGDTWIRPSDGVGYIARGMTGKNMPQLTVDEDFVLWYQFDEDSDDYELAIDDDGNLLVSYGYAEIDDSGVLQAWTAWENIAPSELHTSYIDIRQDTVTISSGGNVNVNAGGALNVNSGAAHFRTAEYTLSILDEDGSEDTVMDFDADGKTLRVTEIRAGNMRPFIAGTTAVTSGSVGGIGGLRDMLQSAQYEHIVYTQSAGDLSGATIEIEGCDSLQVEIIANLPTRVPPLAFTRATGNVYAENLVWSCAGKTAFAADSGNIVLKNCSATAETGISASRHARVTWIGADDTTESAGACTTAAAASEGADVRLYGLIPSGALNETLAGVITSIDTRTGSGSTSTDEEKTVTLTGTIGYYGTSNGWNSGVAYQGYSNGKGRIYGCMKFTLPDDVAAVKAASLTLYRDSSAGRGSAADVTVYGSATAYGSRPTLGSVYAQREDAAEPGASCTLDVTDAAQALLAGDIAQLVLYTGESTTATGKVYSRQYAKFTSAKLKITY